MNGVSICLEEIALEGLDGITISTLWRRINLTKLWSTFDENYQEFLWRCVSSCQDVEAYLLESPRAEILNFADDSKAYPYCCINESGVRGSCSTFHTRKLINVSKQSLKAVVEKYGNRLVLVASQFLRNKVLLGPAFDFSVKIPDPSYCVLEIIGRGRRLGRLHCTLGQKTLVDSKTLFSQVKFLLRLQLVTKQSVYSHSNSNSPTSILYLARYHTDHTHDSIQFKISDALREATGCSQSLKSLRLQLDEKYEIVERAVEELLKSGHVCYVKDTLSDKSSGDLTDGQGSSENLENNVIQFVQQFYDLCVDSDEIEDEEWTQSDYQALSMSIPAELPIRHAIYSFVASKGKDGASLSQCCEELSMPFFKTRRSLKELETDQLLVCKFIDTAKTRKNQYFARSVLTQAPDVQIKQPCTSNYSDIQNTHTPSVQMSKPLSMLDTGTLGTPDTYPPESQTTATPLIQMTQHSTAEVNDPLTTHFTHAISSNTDVTYCLPEAISSSNLTREPSSGKFKSKFSSIQTIPAPSGNSHVAQNRKQHTSDSMIPQADSEITVNEITKDSPQLFINNSKYRNLVTCSSWWEKFTNTEKFLRRKEFVLNLLRKLKVVEGRTVFRKTIIMEEGKLGLGIKIDRKSVSFLIDRLTADGLLRRFEVDVKVEGEQHTLELFCDKSIQQDDEVIGSSIQKFKDKITYEKQMGRNGTAKPNRTLQDRVLPKIPRSELLHIFLFYVVYELNNPDADLEAWQRKYAWVEHIKPEHALTNTPGWFTPYSVLRILPVSLFYKLVDYRYHNSIVQQYIANPATKHMLLKDLPPLAQQILFEKRRNGFLFGSFELLACFGLITPTNKQVFFHERDIECYLHKSNVLKDTRDAEPAYIDAKPPEGSDFSEIPFSFSGLADVEQYWATARLICIATPLNQNKNTPKDTQKDQFKCDLKSFIVDENEVPTCGKPRGDGLGAAGFDSRLFCHRKNKWRWFIKEKQEVESDVEDSMDWQYCFTNDENIAVVSEKKNKRKRPVKSGTAKKKRKVVKTDEKKTGVSQKEEKSSLAQLNGSLSNLPKADAKKKRRRNMKQKKRKAEQNAKRERGHWPKRIQDKRDEDALKELQDKRTIFTPQQQKLLFICCLALRILGKRSTDTGYNDWLWTRDILYKDNYESAKTKTALSIRRKYCSMMKNAQTKTNLNICVADCIQEKEFQLYCNQGKNCTEAMFNELVEILKKKYSMENMVNKPFTLPSTVREFEEQNNCSLQEDNSDRFDEEIPYLEPREASIADVRQRIIRDSIISALLLQSNNWESHVAFTFLSQFTEEELIIAISMLKNRGIVVRKELRYTKSYDLALCAFSEMLSSTSYRAIENSFSSSLMKDTKSFYNEMKCSSKDKSLEPRTLRFSEGAILGGHTFCILSLLTCRRLAINMEVPENFLALEKYQHPVTLEHVSENANKDEHQEINDEMTGNKELIYTSTSFRSGSHEICNNSEDKSSQRCEGSESEVCESKERNDDGNITKKSLTTTSTVKTHENTKVARDEEESRSDDQVNTSQSTGVQNQEFDDLPKESRVLLSGNVNRRRPNDMVLDVLCGIEDHLFGSLDLDMRMYKVDLRPTSTFTSTIITSNVDVVRASEVLGKVKELKNRSNKVYESYVEKIETYRRTGDVNRIQFSVNPCNVQMRMLSFPEKTANPRKDTLAQSVARHFHSNGLKMPETVEEVLHACSKSFGYSSKDCQALRAVYEIIYSRREVGMTSLDVNKLVKHSLVNFSTDGLIKVLEAFNLVHQVGFVEVCYVATVFKKHWLLTIPEADVRSSSELKKLEKKCAGKRKRGTHQGETDTDRKSGNSEPLQNGEMNDGNTVPTYNTSSPNKRKPSSDPASSSINTDELISNKPQSNSGILTGENVTLKKQTSIETQTDRYSSQPCRPWITMAGEMNQNAHNTLHRGVLTYIMKFPGVQKFAIAKHFRNLIFPVAMEDILNKLEGCGCIEQRTCYVKSATLFSSKTGKKTSYYLPKPDAIFKLMERVFLS